VLGTWRFLRGGLLRTFADGGSLSGRFVFRGFPGGLGFGLGFSKPTPSLLADGLEQVAGPLEVPGPPTHGLLLVLGDVLHGGFTPAGLAQVERAVLVGIIRSAVAAGVATAPGHLNEAAVKEPPGLRKQLVETTVETAFFGRK